MNLDPLVSARRLGKDFLAGDTVVRAVDDVAFTSDRGQITLIMGPSGSGKTTLLTLIGALLAPSR
jgi:ABC-type lipoprotein export system ATPase subunit